MTCFYIFYDIFLVFLEDYQLKILNKTTLCFYPSRSCNTEYREVRVKRQCNGIICSSFSSCTVN